MLCDMVSKMMCRSGCCVWARGEFVGKVDGRQASAAQIAAGAGRVEALKVLLQMGGTLCLCWGSVVL